MSSSADEITRQPVRSMTGFALIRRPTPAGELTVSLRTVNHRGLDLHFHQASELSIYENAMRAALKQRVGRGHVEVRLSLSRPESLMPASYDQSFVAAYLAAFRQAALDHSLTQTPDLNVLFALPGVLERGSEYGEPPPDLEPQVVAALHACLSELNLHREREGQAMVAEFQLQASEIEAGVADIERIRQTATHQFYNRLRERLAELLQQSGISEARLAEEAAILTDRSDIQEELTRLKIHVTELRRILDQGGQIGKRLDFLLQEMNRETNTVLSKTSGVGEIGLVVTRRGLAIKAHIEKIREQALNIE